MEEAGWAIFVNKQIDSFYAHANRERALARARLLAQTFGPIIILEMRPVMKITATRGEWIYSEEEIK